MSIQVMDNALDVIGGTGGPDVLNGTAGNDQISGLGGNDVLNGLGGNDFLDGGTGADDMTGGAGNDIYIVDNVNDEVIETAGNGLLDQVQSSVSFTLNGNIESLYLTGNSNINGTGHNNSNDYIEGNDRNNQLQGLNGNDVLIGNAGNDVLTGGNGNDQLYGGAGSDRLVGGAGDDDYTLIEDNDTIVEGNNAGNDTVFVVDRSYTMASNLENMFIDGNNVTGRGNGLANNMELISREGGALFGNGGNDVLTALFDGDLHGGAGNDTISGSRLNKFFGDDGNDRLTISNNMQDATGGGGNDIFVFNYEGTDIAAHARRSVLDFRASNDDIVIDDNSGLMDAVGPGVLGAQYFLSAANAATAVATTANHHYIFNRATGELYYDDDGVGGAAQHLIGLIDVDQGTLAASHFTIA